MESSFNVVGPNFWRDFVAKYWRKEPVALKHPFMHNLGSEGDCLLALQQLRRQTSRAKPRIMPRFFVNNREVEVTPSLLPNEEDTSLQTYVERMVHRHVGKGFGLLVNGFQLLVLIPIPFASEVTIDTPSRNHRKATFI
jgi:hypothetical protein